MLHCRVPQKSTLHLFSDISTVSSYNHSLFCYVYHSPVFLFVIQGPYGNVYAAFWCCGTAVAVTRRDVLERECRFFSTTCRIQFPFICFNVVGVARWLRRAGQQSQSPTSSTGYPALASKKQQRFETCVSPLRQSTLERNANCTTVETPHACPVRWVFRPTLVECVSYSLGRRGQGIWELVLNWWIICYSVN